MSGSIWLQRTPDIELTRRRLLEISAAAGVALAVPASAAGEAAQTPRRGGWLKVGFIGGGTEENLIPYGPTSGFSYVDHARYRNLYDRIVEGGARAGT